MNRIILCTFIMLFGIAPTSQLSAQEKYIANYQVKYKVSYRLDTTNRSDQSEEDFYLYTGTKGSVFTTYDVIKFDKKMERLKKKYGNRLGVLYPNKSRNPSLNKTFYKDLQSHRVKTTAKIDKQQYIFDEPLTQLHWTIKDSTKTLKGYEAQKATIHFGGRNYIAWFTIAIPIPDGPYLFSGLPGLIVELYDQEKDYYFKLASLKKLEEPKTFMPPEKAKPISKKKFQKLHKKFISNVLHSSNYLYMMANTQGIIGLSQTMNGETTFDLKDKSGQPVSKEEMKRRFKREIKSQNNPIELR